MELNTHPKPSTGNGGGLPSCVVVSGYRYRIHEDEAELNAYQAATRSVVDGYTRHGLQVIGLDPNQGPDSKRECLLHEVMHACSLQSGLNSVENPTEEQIIRHLAPVLWDTLRRNPDLVRYVLAEEAGE